MAPSAVVAADGICEREFEDAEEFLEALHPLRGNWVGDPPLWVFRAQSDSSWPLVLGSLSRCRARASRSVQGPKRGRHRRYVRSSMYQSSTGRTAAEWGQPGVTSTWLVAEGRLSRVRALAAEGRLFHVRAQAQTLTAEGKMRCEMFYSSSSSSSSIRWSTGSMRS
jgi:hypothetical protein